jgi:hypothetical protein
MPSTSRRRPAPTDDGENLLTEGKQPLLGVDPAAASCSVRLGPKRGVRPARATDLAACNAGGLRPRSRRQPSLRLDAGLPHYRAPPSGLIAHKCAEFLGRAALDVRSLIGQALANAGDVQNFDELGIEPLHD